MAGEVVRLSSGGPWEDVVGYSRVVAVGDHAWVAGSTAFVDGRLVGPGDPYQQARVAIRVALDALARAGFSPDDVVRTRMFLTDRNHADAVGRAHAELLGSVRPAATMLVVSGFVDAAMLVEVEVDAARPS